MNYEDIPFILNVGTFEQPAPRGLRQFAELLQLAYKLLEHPLFFKDTLGRVDPFKRAMVSAEAFRNFNRTVVERTISQAVQFSEIKVDGQYLTLCSQGTERALEDLRESWMIANDLAAHFDEAPTDGAAYMHAVCIRLLGKFDAQLRYLLTTTQQLITLVLQGSVISQAKKLPGEQEQYKFLVRWQGDLKQKEDQFPEESFQALMKTIDIELEVLERSAGPAPALTAEMLAMVKSFLKEREAQVSGNDLLACLLQEDYAGFQDKLKAVVMRMFSYHDVSNDVPEKVYHMFLLGLFINYNQHYEVRSNLEAGLGRFDLLMVPHDRTRKGLIFEVKRSASDKPASLKKQAYEALEQINDKQYATELKTKGAAGLTGFGVAFYGKVLFIDHEATLFG